jgi:hypothetical protein
MTILKQVLGKQVAFGGEQHQGWLTSNAATPRPTSIENAMLDLSILEEGGGGGYLLQWISRNSHHSGDTWHSTIREAEEEAQQGFGIDPSEWSRPTNIA